MAKSKTNPTDGKRTGKAGNTPAVRAVRKEAKCLGMGVAGLLLLGAVLIPDRIGVIGRFFRSILVGLFGFGGLVLPLALVFFAVVGLISKKFVIPWLRSGVVAWLFLAWLHIIVDNIGIAYTGMAYLREAYSSNSLLGGGVFGAVLGRLFMLPLNRVPAILVISAAIIILLILMTGRSFVKFIEQGAGKARDLYEEKIARADDEEYEYDDDEEYKTPKKIKKRPADTDMPAGDLKPLNSRRKEDDIKTDGKAELFDFDPDADPVYDDEDDFTVLLVQEELEGVSEEREERPREIPPFIRDANVRATTPRILNFNGGVAEEPAAYVNEHDDEYDDLEYTELDFSENQEGEYVHSPVVVKGMVDDATDPVEYDEYAHISRLAGKAVPSVEKPPAEHSYEDFELPPLDILGKNEKPQTGAESRQKVMENSRILEETLRSFRVEAKVVEVSVGPTVTRYDLSPGPGVKVSAIANLSNDLALSLAAQGIRIEAPIPGKSAVGIEIPNKDPQGVYLREIIECDKFVNFNSKLAFAVGKDIAGSPVVADVADMPHLLIAGATGAGKSVCINTLIASILYKARPDEVKLLMIDPKVVELSVYNGIPHLLIPVVTDPKKASGALNWAVQEMETRYAAFAETGCRDLKGYNKHLSENDEPAIPQIVIIIDELADLMMTAKGEVEEAICRLAQKARAAGIHLIVATQRPSVDVITGLIKANIPSRLAFAVSSGTDSRTVLDMHGAEKLVGRGDMLFLPRGLAKPVRIQGGFISDKEVETLVAFLKAQAPVEHTTEMIQQVTMPGKANIEGELDEFFHDAVDFLLVKGKASTSMLQRQFRIGYNRASRLMEDLELRGIVGPEDGVKPRKVTITREEYREIYGEQ